MHRGWSVALCGCVLVLAGFRCPGAAPALDAGQGGDLVGGQGGDGGSGADAGAGAQGGSAGHGAGGDCTPTVEECNGEDDDCDGLDDFEEGCADHVVIDGPRPDLGPFGSGSNNFDELLCPSGYAMTGMLVSGDAALRVSLLGAKCAAMLVDDDFTLVWAEEVPIDIGSIGEPSVDDAVLECGEDEWVAGLAVHSDAETGDITNVGVECGAMKLDGTPSEQQVKLEQLYLLTAWPEPASLAIESALPGEAVVGLFVEGSPGVNAIVSFGGFLSDISHNNSAP